jgi:hypothetical protein
VRALDGIFQGPGGDNLRCASDLGFDLRGGCADGVDAFYPLSKQVVENRVVAAFVLAAQNQVDIRGK